MSKPDCEQKLELRSGFKVENRQESLDSESKNQETRREPIRLRHHRPARAAGGLDLGSHLPNNLMRFLVKPASPAGRHGMTKEL